jgi:energy-coupling factor transporter transmembrane protein EcfT
VAHFIPDFIILNLNKADSITGVMEMRGYGQTFPRSIYPLISFRPIDFFWMIAVFAMLFGVHTFVTI